MSDDEFTKPVEDDERYDDREFNPAVEPRKSKAWLNLLLESEDNFERWNNHCDNIDKLYANLETLAEPMVGSQIKDKQYQMFWANCEVMKPSIYAKAPIPVVVPKFKDRRPVYQEASEVMERCAIVAFDLAHINDLMLLIRDDVAIAGRGVAWCRYESGKGKGYYPYEKVCIDFKSRRDFLHSISRNWSEVGWVAAASYLTRAEARQRFHEYSGDAYQEAEYKVDRDSQQVGGADARERAKFWEIWSKGDRRVLWVAHGVEDILDEDDPHLDLRDFFPCPKPAYGTCQRGSLVPVPDAMQYQDQLKEINMLTQRIHALSDALECKGFYPAGGGELGEAIKTAINIKSPGEVIVPIYNWATFGGTKDPIVWMPIDMIATTIQALVLLRKQIIDDVYQITGMADIMRGDTDPQETLGAQRLKSQYGTTRIRDKQHELVRIARDLVEITTEIISEKFSKVTIIEMSQTQVPTEKMQQKQINNIHDDVRRKQQALQIAKSSPQYQQAQQQNPDAVKQLDQELQQMMQSAQDSIDKIANKPNLDQVFNFIKDNRAKAFVLDIETDSTIMIDEEQDKQSRAEFLGMMSQMLQQLGQMIGADPQSADLCGQILKFSMKPYRVGRELDGAVDEYVEKVKARGDQPRADDPSTAQGKIALQIEQMKLQYAKTKDDADRQVKVQQMQVQKDTGMAKVRTDAQAKLMEVQGRQQEHNAKVQEINLNAQHAEREHQMDMNEMQMKAQTEAQKNAMLMQQNAAKNAQMARQNQMKETDMLARQQGAQQDREFKRQQAFNKPQGPI